MQKEQESAAEGKTVLPLNVHIREQEHWNVVVKKQIRRGKKGSQEPLAVEGWTGAFVLNPRKRHLKVDQRLVTVCGTQGGIVSHVDGAADRVGKQPRKKRGRGVQGKENGSTDDKDALEAPPDWLLSALLQLKEAPVELQAPVKPDTGHSGGTTVAPAPQPVQQHPASHASPTGEVKRRSFKPGATMIASPEHAPRPIAIAPAPSRPSPIPSRTSPIPSRTSPIPVHPFNYSCKCSSCLTAMIPVPFQYAQR